MPPMNALDAVKSVELAMLNVHVATVRYQAWGAEASIRNEAEKAASSAFSAAKEALRLADEAWMNAAAKAADGRAALERYDGEAGLAVTELDAVMASVAATKLSVDAVTKAASDRVSILVQSGLLSDMTEVEIPAWEPLRATSSERASGAQAGPSASAPLVAPVPEPIASVPAKSPAASAPVKVKATSPAAIMVPPPVIAEPAPVLAPEVIDPEPDLSIVEPPSALEAVVSHAPSDSRPEPVVEEVTKAVAALVDTVAAVDPEAQTAAGSGDAAPAAYPEVQVVSAPPPVSASLPIPTGSMPRMPAPAAKTAIPSFLSRPKIAVPGM